MLSGDGGRSAGHAGRAQKAKGEISPSGPTWPRELANCPTRRGPWSFWVSRWTRRRSASLHRLCERGGTGWVSDGRFDRNRHGLCAGRAQLRRTAVAMPLRLRSTTQPCLDAQEALVALIITHVSHTGGNLQARQHVRASSVFSPISRGAAIDLPKNAWIRAENVGLPPESLDSYALKKSALSNLEPATPTCASKVSPSDVERTYQRPPYCQTQLSLVRDR